MPLGKIFVFSAPSGAGKTTLLDILRTSMPGLVYSVSATTRPPRAHEVNGVHYFFLSKEEFKARIARDEFAEWAEVYGNFYGTPKAAVDATIAAGNSVVMDLDVYGKKKFDAVYPQAIGIFIVPPSLMVLERRLRDRKSDSEESIRTRMANARAEIDFAEKAGKYEYTVVNDDLKRAVNEVIQIVRRNTAG
ncbi:MAG: guanylate kinase [Chitinivibrionales bacterium]|nr:guanylate kinase [Chitinivibrionales bacterium]